MKVKKLVAFTLLAMLLVSTMACGGGVAPLYDSRSHGGSDAIQLVTHEMRDCQVHGTVKNVGSDFPEDVTVGVKFFSLQGERVSYFTSPWKDTVRPGKTSSFSLSVLQDVGWSPSDKLGLGIASPNTCEDILYEISLKWGD